MKFNIKSEWLLITIILAIWLISAIFYPQLPDQIPTHWNMAGEIDQWSSKANAVLLFPGIITGIYLLFLAIPYLEPRRKHFLQSWGFYKMMKYAMVIYLVVIYGLSLWAAFDNTVSMETFVPISVGMLFILIGNYLGQVKSNFLMGIRTPWTLSSEESWRKTHRLGGIMFTIAGLLYMIVPFIHLRDPWNAIIPMAAVLLAAVVTIVYSYIFFLEDKNKTRL